MQITCELTSLPDAKKDAIAVFIFQDKHGLGEQIEALGNQIGEKLQPAISLKDFSAKKGELLSLYTEKSIASPRLFLIGMGETEKLTLEKIRRGSAAAAKAAQTVKIGSLGIEFPMATLSPLTLKASPSEIAQAIVEGAALSVYKYDKYITIKEEEKKLESLTIFTSDKKRLSEIRRVFRMMDNCSGSDYSRFSRRYMGCR